MIKKVAMAALVALVGNSFSAAVSGAKSLSARGSYVEMGAVSQCGIEGEYRMPLPLPTLDLLLGLGFNHLKIDKTMTSVSSNQFFLNAGAEYGILQGQMINPFVRAKVDLIYQMTSSKVNIMGTSISTDDSGFEWRLDLGAGVEIDLGVLNLRPNIAYENIFTKENSDELLLGIDANFALSKTIAVGAGFARALEKESNRFSLLFQMKM